MKLNKWTAIFAALMLCMGVFFSPVTAYAKTDKDETPPTVTAEVRGETLHIEAYDEHSGVESVYVDGHKFTELVNGVLDIPLKEYAGNAAKVGIYAVDYAGNKSSTVQVDNPYYQTPVSLTPPAETQNDGGQATQPEPGSSAGNPFTPDGAGTVLDKATDEDGKDFYTITTPDGYVYFLVIDHQRQGENVYFLNAVTEDDLMGLTQSEGVPGQSAIPTPVPEPEPNPEPEQETPDPEPGETEEAEKGGVGTILFIVLAIAAVGGAGWYFKIYKPKQQAAMDDEDEFDIEDDDEDDLLSETEDYDFDSEGEEYYQTTDDAEYLDD